MRSVNPVIMVHNLKIVSYISIMIKKASKKTFIYIYIYKNLPNPKIYDFNETSYVVVQNME